MLLQQEKILNTLNKLLGQTPKMRKNGTQAMYFCPKCNHYKRKLEISLIDGKYHCWVCGLAGKSFKSLLRKFNAPREYYDIIGESFKPKQTELIDDIFNEKEEIKSANTLPEDFIPLSVPNKTLLYKHAMQYLKRRNITDIDIIRYNLGYCEQGKYRNRIVIPSYDQFGNLNFFSCRDFFDTSRCKYINCEYSKNIVGFEMLIDFTDTVTLVEGGFDAMAVKRNCIPLFGKTLSEALKIKLLENCPLCVNIILDNDAISDSIDACEFLIKNNIKVKLVRLEGKDPSFLGFEQTWECVNNTELLTFDELFKLKINL